MLPALLALVLAQDVSEPRSWPGKPLVTEAGSPACPYRVVMDVEANTHASTIFGRRPTPERVAKEMREKVRKAGVDADAIIEARFSPEHATAVWGRVVTGSGKAVKFTDPACAPR